ncbi:MAG: fatty acid desaturase, partial [Crocinitomicaceae bacterium]
NTANFAPKAKLLSWFVGGLNYQVEHHLFPNICHVHYKNISKIVKETAIEYNLPYYSYATFFAAIKDHAKLLKRLGKHDVLAPVAVKSNNEH